MRIKLSHQSLISVKASGERSHPREFPPEVEVSDKEEGGIRIVVHDRSMLEVFRTSGLTVNSELLDLLAQAIFTYQSVLTERGHHAA